VPSRKGDPEAVYTASPPLIGRVLLDSILFPQFVSVLLLVPLVFRAKHFLEDKKSMDYLHYEADLNNGQAIEVTLDQAANVLVLDSVNYMNYRGGQQYRYYGGHATVSPYIVRPPHAGHWHVVINLGGYAGTVRASVRVIS
jgi:hypothetical protein